jgi:beta-N-acetylhexosaminidase
LPVARVRRRRLLATAGIAAAAVGAFALGAAVGDGPSEARRTAAERLPPRLLAGQRIVLGFEGARVPAAVATAIREGRAAGVILFADNLPSREAARRLTARLQAIPHPATPRDPLLIMTDQEGGLVKRLGGAPSASAEQMGARGAPFSRRQGRRTAANLLDVGVNVNLAPVLDVARPGGVIEETDRGFGSSPERVADTAVAFAEAMGDRGVAATAKHFPGLGAAAENTDFATQRIKLSKRRLRRVDERPYRRFVGADGALVMISSAIYPAYGDRPAAFARTVATGELRGRLGFAGVSITDALDTVAVRAFGGPGRAGVAAAAAGTDLLLFTDLGSAVRAHRALRRRLQAGALPRPRFERSAQRVLTLRHRLDRRASQRSD